MSNRVFRRFNTYGIIAIGSVVSSVMLYVILAL